MKLSVIIVSWNTAELTLQSVASVYKQTPGFDFEIFVVDNHSSDDSVARLKKEYPQVRIIPNNDNLGFAKANNQALALASGDYLMFLNSDVIVLDGAIGKLVNYLDTHPDVMMVGPRLLNCDGTFQHACRRNLPNPLNSFMHLFGLGKLSAYKRMNDSPDITGETEALSGAAMMFRRRVWVDIGGLDEMFFMYGEDLDFCKRILDKGWKIVYVGEAKITHLGGSSTKKRKTKSIKNFYEAMWLYWKKHFYKKYNPVVSFFIWTGIKFRLAIALILNAL